jgi:hypothetical protein
MVVEEPRLGFHAHITPGEWSEYVKPRDAKGGSFNRLLPVMVEGSKVLPYGHKELYPEIPGLDEAYDWVRKTPRVISLDNSAARRFDELRAIFLDKLTEMPKHLRCYVERTPEQIIRVAATLVASERRTTVSRKAIDAAWAFVQYSMRSVEKLVRGDDVAESSRRVTKDLPDLIREILDRYEGEVTSSLMLRSLGMRATAASLRSAIEGMDDVEVVRGETATGRGRRPVLYRRTSPSEAVSEEPEESAEPPETEALTVPDILQEHPVKLSLKESSEAPELVLAGGWL